MEANNIYQKDNSLNMATDDHRSSTCRCHNDSLSFFNILLHWTSSLRNRLAVDHELKTVLPSSYSFAATSVVITKEVSVIILHEL
ncbi:hypothetical protein Tco_1179450 [Tanacetum coccineum]